MKTQISRWSDRPASRYQGVYLQQGRMVTDADWNEQVEHAKRALRAIASDAVGNGVPREGGCLTRVLGTDTEATLRWGAAHVDGMRAALVPADGDLAQAFDAGAQADLLAAAGQGLQQGLGLYLDVWERTVVSLQDDVLVDPALAGADTASREQVMAQLKHCPVDQQGRPIAGDPARNPTVGNARIAASAREAGADPDPCDPCANELALDQAVPNALFRLEVHDVDVPVGPSRIELKWSMENGAEVATLDPDPPLGFVDPSHVYEVFNTRTEQNMGVFLTPPGGDTAAPALAADLTGLPDPPAGDQWKGIRRWDGRCVLERAGGAWSASVGTDRGLDLVAGADAITVEGDTVVLPLRHLEVRLSLGGGGALHVLRGDHWLVRVRTQPAPGAGPDLRVQPVSETPHGIRHHYLVLGTWDGDAVQMGTDVARRARSFPPLTDVRATDVGYTPCLDGPFDAQDTTVQKALDALCAQVEEDGDDCTPRLKLFGRGIVCGAIPTVAPVQDPRTGVLDAIGDVLRAAPIERTVAEREIAEREIAERGGVRDPRGARRADRGDERVVRRVQPTDRELREERAELIAELVDGVETDRIDDVRREVRAIRGAETGGRFDEAVRLIETFRAGSFRQGVTVRFATTAGTVVDGLGCYHDVGPLELRTLIPSWRLVFSAPEVFPRVREELLRAAEEQPPVGGREFAASTWRRDVGGRVDAILRRVIDEDPATSDEVRRVLTENFDWRAEGLRELVADRFTASAERERVPVRASGHLYLVFPDGVDAALEFRGAPPAPWVKPPKLLAATMAGAFAAASGVSTKKQALAVRAVEAAVVEAGGLDDDAPAIAVLLEEASDGAGNVDVRRLASRVRNFGGALPSEGELAAILAESIAAGAQPAADQPVAARAVPAQPDVVVPEVVVPDGPQRPPVDLGDLILDRPDLVDVVFPDVVAPKPQPPSVLERAWDMFEDIECPQPNDGAVCLGRVAAYGDRIAIVPDDREQLLATPAHVNAMYVRRLPTLFGRVMDDISGGDA